MKKINKKREDVLFHQRTKRNIVKKRNRRKSGDSMRTVKKSSKNYKIKNIVIPDKFNLYSNPDDVLDVINELDGLDNKTGQYNELFFDFLGCNSIDIASTTLIDISAQRKINETKWYGQTLKVNGRHNPHKHNIDGYLKYIGILKHLGFVPPNTGKNDRSVDFIDLLRGGKSHKFMSVKEGFDSNNASTEVVDFYNKVLKKKGLELTVLGHRQIFGLISEVIDNCRIHAPHKKDSDYQWFVNAFHKSIDDTSSEISIVIINYGQTIYEGLSKMFQRDDLDNIQTRQKNKIVRLSEKNRSRKTDIEALYTLYALQQNVSRLISDSNPTRGMGTIQLIETFKKLGDTVDKDRYPKMCILSGSSYIKFDNKYEISEDSKERKIITFNKENDLEIPPDPNNVYKLNNYFGGTIISMDFYLDKSHIAKINGEKYE